MNSVSRPAPDPLYVFYDFVGGVSAVSFVEFKNTTYLLTGDYAGQCSFWSLETKKPIWTRRAEDSEIPTAASSVKHSSILSCGAWTLGIWAHIRGKSVRFWSYTNENGVIGFVEQHVINNKNIGFCGAQLLRRNDQENMLAALTDDTDCDKMVIYTLDEKSVIRQTTLSGPSAAVSSGKTGAILCCTFSPSTTSDVRILLGTDSGIVQLWSLTPQTELMLQCDLLPETILCLDYSPLLSMGACGSPEKRLKRWRLDANDPVKSVETCPMPDVTLPFGGLSSVKFRPDGKLLAAGGWDGKIRVFAPKNGNPLAVLQFHRDGVQCLCFAENPVNGRRLLAAGSKDGSLSLWHLYD